MRKLKKSTAMAVIAAMSLSMLPTSFSSNVVSAAQVKKVTAKKTEITVKSSKELKRALKKKM